MQSILQHFFKKTALQDIPVDEIEQCIHQYPFFPLGHFLLTKKLQPDNDTAFREQLQKTTVYFHNPLWLLHLLQQKEMMNKTAEPFQPSVKTTINGSQNDDLAVSDLIEDVVLHQETVYQMPEELSLNQTTILEDGPTYPLVEKIQGMVDETELAAEDGTEDGPMNNQKDSVLVQAYHTIDYFASQGIKINQETQADDKLGKQLKSFTEWLKTMRRLAETLEEVMEKNNDKEVEKLAAHSLEENEVITEAMAEVLAKQGKPQRAREVYHKLSLLNPHKIAYFAARIEALNLH